MGKVIAVINDKGGVGKTTVSTNLAYEFQQAFFQLPIGSNESLLTGKVLLVDSDPQGSAGDWHEANGGKHVECISIPRTTLAKDIERMKDNYNLIIIDGAPRIDKLASAAIMVSDLVLIPVQPSPYDVWATKDLVDLVIQRQEITGNTQPLAAFVINRLLKNSILARDVQDALDAYEIPTLKSKLTNFVAYPTTAQSGLGVTSEKGPAAIEFSALVEEVALLLKLSIDKNKLIS